MAEMVNLLVVLGMLGAGTGLVWILLWLAYRAQGGKRRFLDWRRMG